MENVLEAQELLEQKTGAACLTVRYKNIDDFVEKLNGNMPLDSGSADGPELPPCFIRHVRHRPQYQGKHPSLKLLELRSNVALQPRRPSCVGWNSCSYHLLRSARHVSLLLETRFLFLRTTSESVATERDDMHKVIDHELSSYVKRMTEKWEVQGATIAVVRPDGEVEFGASGNKD